MLLEEAEDEEEDTDGRGENMLTLIGYMMMLPVYILIWSLKLMGKTLSLLFWGVIIILGLCV